MALVEFDEKKKVSSRKKIIAEFLRSQGILEEKDTGQVVINVNEGGVVSIYFNKKVY